jgi:hypothetical protein
MVENITNNKVFWFFGVPTAGKSWSADFCATYHDWIHLDGDEKLMRGHPDHSVMVGNLFNAFEYTLKYEEPPAEFIEPWLD